MNVPKFNFRVLEQSNLRELAEIYGELNKFSITKCHDRINILEAEWWIADSATYQKCSSNSQQRGYSTDFDSRPVSDSNTPRLRIQLLSFRVTLVSGCFAHSISVSFSWCWSLYRVILVANDVSRNTERKREGGGRKRERERYLGTRVIVICFLNVSPRRLSTA